MAARIVAGYQVIDFKAMLFDGTFRDVYFSVLAFDIGAKAAFGEEMPQAGAKFLEPLMMVEVFTPEE